MDHQAFAQLLGNYGEFVGSIGVVVSLLYLSLQIRSNTNALRANSGFQSTHSWGQLNEDIATAADEVVASFVGIYEETKDFTELSDVQHLRLNLLTRAIFDKLEGQYFLYKYGQLEPEVWHNRANVARGILELPYYKRWWKTQGKSYSKGLVLELEQARPISAANINRRWERTQAE